MKRRSKGDIHINGDKARIRQLIGILLDNALKYSESFTAVNVSLTRQGYNALITVSNRGTTAAATDLVCQLQKAS